MKYWVMQVINGKTGAIGPYASQSARDKRLEKTEGGEVSAYRSEETDPHRVIQEFQDDKVGGY